MKRIVPKRTIGRYGPIVLFEVYDEKGKLLATCRTLAEAGKWTKPKKKRGKK